MQHWRKTNKKKIFRDASPALGPHGPTRQYFSPSVLLPTSLSPSRLFDFFLPKKSGKKRKEKRKKINMGTEPSQTPTPPPPPPPASPRRRAPQPATILSPSFSRNPLRATAASASASAGPVPSPSSSSDCEEHPCVRSLSRSYFLARWWWWHIGLNAWDALTLFQVELFDWWLKRVEGDDRKVRIAGHTERWGVSSSNDSSKYDASFLFWVDASPIDPLGVSIVCMCVFLSLWESFVVFFRGKKKRF